MHLEDEKIIDTVNDLYVTQVPGQLYYKLYNNDGVLHSHSKHIYDGDIEEPVTVYTMVHLYANELQNKAIRETNAVMSSLRAEFDDGDKFPEKELLKDIHSKWVDGKKPPLRCNSAEITAAAAEVDDVSVTGASWYWDEAAHPGG
jgi:hypothetical protein